MCMPGPAVIAVPDPIVRVPIHRVPRHRPRPLPLPHQQVGRSSDVAPAPSDAIDP